MRRTCYESDDDNSKDDNYDKYNKDDKRSSESYDNTCNKDNISKRSYKDGPCYSGGYFWLTG